MIWAECYNYPTHREASCFVGTAAQVYDQKHTIK